MQSIFALLLLYLVAPTADVREAQLGIGADLVYIFAVGPDLFDPTRVDRKGTWFRETSSSYARSVAAELGARAESDYSFARKIQLPAFTAAQLREKYSELYAQAVAPQKIMLFIVSHGGVNDNGFYFWSHDGDLNDSELLKIIEGTPTETAIFACRSGAADVSRFPGGVFGASLKHTPMDAEHFYGWAGFISEDDERKFPSSAREMFDSWNDYRRHKGLENKAHPFFFAPNLEIEEKLQPRC